MPHSRSSLTLTREIIKVHPCQPPAKKSWHNVGYLRIKEFNELTNDELKSAIAELLGQNSSRQNEGYILYLVQQSGRLASSGCPEVVNLDLHERGRDRIDARPLTPTMTNDSLPSLRRAI